MSPELVETKLAWSEKTLSLAEVCQRLSHWDEKTLLPNPHLEPPVSIEKRGRAGRASVSIILAERPSLSVIVTRRSQNIRFAGQICFPGGRHNPEDSSLMATALRETYEEIGLEREALSYLGCLGTYYTQTGYILSPQVFLAAPDVSLKADPSEVAEIYWLPLAELQRKHHYRLLRRSDRQANFQFVGAGVQIGGPTVSLIMHLLRCISP